MVINVSNLRLRNSFQLIGFILATAHLETATGVSPAGCPAGVVFPSNTADSLTCDARGECSGCPVTCDPSQHCEITCKTQEACKDMVVTCPATATCRVVCSNSEACQGIKINCPTTGSCTVICSGSESCTNSKVLQPSSTGGALDVQCTGYQSCHDIQIDCPGPSSCNAVCSTESCRNAVVSGGTLGSLSVTCNGNACYKLKAACPLTGDCTLGCSGSQSCSEAVITTPPAASGSLKLKCSANQACDQASVTCPESGDCNLICDGFQGCISAAFECPKTAPCTMECKESSSCKLTTLTNNRGGAATTVSCTGFESCLESNVACGTSDCTRKCDGGSSCKGSTIDCTSAPQCSLTCMASSACENGKVDCALGYPAGKSCSLTCTDYHACTGSTPTGAIGPVKCSAPATSSCSPFLQNIAASNTAVPGVPTSEAPATPFPDTTSPATATPTTSPDTNAPATGAPKTQFPATFAPDTNPPATGIPGVPPTNAPDTNPPVTGIPGVPPTNAPDTNPPATGIPGVPPTNAPDTNPPATGIPGVPPTNAPVTNTPSTRSPGTGARVNATAIPEEHKGKVETASSIATTAGLLGGAGAGSASRILVLKNFGCQVEDVDLEEEENLDWEFHPLRIGVLHNGRRYMTAAMLLNPVVLIAMYIILLFITVLIHFGLNVTWHKAAGNARSPSLVYIPYLFLLQGTSLVAARLAFYPRSDSTIITFLAVVSLLMCVVSPGVLYMLVGRRIGDNACQILDPKLFPREGDDPNKKYTGKTALMYRFIFGEFVWVSRDLETCFVEKYGVVFESFKQDLAWFPTVEPCVMIALSILSSWHPAEGSASQCNARNLLVCLLFFGFLVALLFYRPFTSIFDNGISISLCFMMFLSVLLMTIGIWIRTAQTSLLFVIPVYLLLISAVLVLMKCIFDIVAYGTDIWIGRKSGAREMLRKEQSRSYFKTRGGNPLGFKKAFFGSVNGSEPASEHGQFLMENQGGGLEPGEPVAPVVPPVTFDSTPSHVPAVATFQNVNSIIITCEAVV